MSDSTYRKFSKRASLYDTIFQLHHIGKEDFKKSLAFYQGRPDLLKEMLDDLGKKVTADTSSKHGSPEMMQRAKRINKQILPK